MVLDKLPMKTHSIFIWLEDFQISSPSSFINKIFSAVSQSFGKSFQTY